MTDGLGNMGSLAGLCGLDAADRLGGASPDGAGVLAKVDGDRVGGDVDSDGLPGVDPNGQKLPRAKKHVDKSLAVAQFNNHLGTTAFQ